MTVSPRAAATASVDVRRMNPTAQEGARPQPSGNLTLCNTCQLPQISVGFVKGLPMKTRAAVAYEAGKPLVIEEVDLEGPKAGEVLVEIKATGVCHTDEFTRSGAAVRVATWRRGLGICNWIGPLRSPG